MSELLDFFADNSSLLADKTLEHLAISAIGLAAALVLALPLGVVLGHFHRGSFVAISVSNGLRALPSLALIAISLAMFGLSALNIQIALVALAVPPILTNAFTAVDNVDPDAVEAANGMGMRFREVLLGVEIPLALPLIFAGIRTAAVYIVATASLAGIGGGGGLGDIILNQPTYELAGVGAATILVVTLAFAADGLLALLQRAFTPRALRASGDVLAPVVTSEATAMERAGATT
jgi:osmoprotectant transport system permease protein